MYEIKKVGKTYQVVAKSSGIVQYSSTKRAWCVDWIADNSKEGA